MPAVPIARLLIVDDETAQMKALHDTLEAEGYSAAGFTSAAAALAELRDSPFDLVLTDLMMPEMDGVAFLHAAFEIDPTLTGIVMTGRGTVDTAVRAMQAGALDYILKPFRLSAVLPVLTRALEVRRVRMENVELHQAVRRYELHEIEERRRAEEQIRLLNGELERRVQERTGQLEAANIRLAEFAATLDETHATIHKLDGTILYWNSGAESLYGWSREEAMGRKSHELLETEYPRPLVEIQTELVKHGSWSGECKQRCRDGSVIWVASHLAAHRDAQGELVSVVWMNNDITELKRTSEALHTSEATARSLFENASQGILTADPEGRVVDANGMSQTLFGYSHDELIGASIEMLLPARLRSDHIGHRARYELSPHTRPVGQGMDLVGRRKDGSEFPIEIGLSYVAEHRGGGLSMAFISDITARKQASLERETLIAGLEAALSEKTVLLKEIHHRVKNNLAVIAGLLGMQADRIADKQAANALGESQRRVLSMALIHEYLYSSENLDRVNFGKYLGQLSNELCVAYAIEPGLVHVTIEAEEVDLPVHRAIPCGLILTELLSNAMKYGFPNGRSGGILVRFARLEPDNLSLSCEDDGIGIPESFDWQNPKSLGLRIVMILTKQLDGDLTLDRSGGGTRFDLRFPSHGKV